MNIIEWKQDKIKGVLSTFDRIIIKGYSRQLSNIKQMGYFLSHNNVLLKDFGTYAENVTKSFANKDFKKAAELSLNSEELDSISKKIQEVIGDLDTIIDNEISR